MSAQATLGKVLGRLRRIRGLSVEECEEQMRVPAGTLRGGEAGRALTESLIRAVARLHGLDAELLEEGQIRPILGLEGSTVFLLHSGNQDFSARDLGALEEGLTAGRMLCTAASGQPRAALAVRWALAAVPVAGPESRDAARQGYRLANHVRRALRLGSDRLGDLRALLEDRLGIAVFVPEFPSNSVEAASIVDAGRIAACAMISASVVDAAHPRMRTLLAHELCHVLFDPASPGAVRLSVHRGDRNTTLEESRAKGFAAEFLLPRDGLVAVLGQPQQESSLQTARGLVQKARESFGTTSEIAVWHLKNHKFIGWDVADELVTEPVAAQVVVHTSLPRSGVYPTDAPPESLRSGFETSVVLAKAVAKRAPAYCEDAARLLLLDASTTENELEATDDLLLELDRHLAASNLELFKQVLEFADCRRLRPSVIGGLLLLSKAARSRIAKQTSDFEARALRELEARLSPTDFARVQEQFA